MARKKITMEKNSKESGALEDVSAMDLVEYSATDFVVAVNDLSKHVNNAYFKTPYSRCPDCNKGNNTVMAHFGKGGPSNIGNLSGFQATVGDVIGWNSTTYNGLSLVKSKENGTFGLESAFFAQERKEPAVVERIIIPSKYRPIIGKMAVYLANKDNVMYRNVETIKIGEGEYPNVIEKELQNS